MELIVTTPEQLAFIIRAEFSKLYAAKPQEQQQPDRCALEDALEITGLSKSKIYKLTSSKDIPHKRFGSRLIFSRKELEEWVESQTVDSDDTGSATATLARSARAKKKGGCRG